MGQYGLNLGIAFQMVDDVLDIVGHKELLGKPTGMDLRDGNPSLPIVLSLRVGQKAVMDAFECPNPSEGKIRGAIEAKGRWLGETSPTTQASLQALRGHRPQERKG